ncbi:isocitrate lyase/phosphoenolpyruvate mutase family protein [uncultured Microbacterium sp.]|uniref:isocitrate lyase/PEP mutase family protein n=1 Tax=uncultured Microbacterium sp. TaxID=191216 RepID=UPI0025E9F922|nr:isocitrate lyase/phosphoenolpyruvate mutase family protein [uncultured Microbacterium sp.]
MTVPAAQRARADGFRSLHVPGDPLVLVNAWDPVSARITEQAGVRAIATTSAGIAWANGSADGHRLDRDTALRALQRIVVAVDGRLPVTADLEDGFGAGPAAVAETVAEAVALGVVGVNLEDSLRAPGEQAERLAAARAAADASGCNPFINARIDTHSLLGDAERWMSETVLRARAYAEAGADGILVLGAVSATALRALVGAVEVPVNVALDATTLPVAELAEAGAARISVGSAVAEAVHAATLRMAQEVVNAGVATETAQRLSWSRLNDLF